MFKIISIIVGAVLGFLLLLLGVILGLSYYWATPDTFVQHEDSPAFIAELGKKTNHDYGQIDQTKGNFLQRYMLVNTGAAAQTIVGATTSCECTTIQIDGVWHGMHNFFEKPSFIIPAGETADVMVKFDPNAHGPFSLGKLKRIITLTSAEGVETLITFSAEVVQGSGSSLVEQVSSSSGVFQFEAAEFDFGTIQQSGGVVQHDFAFVYLGREPVTIIGTPTSCGCTTATIDKQVYQSGESGILTVLFNPNLHAEPSGRFFKTVSVVTNPALPLEPEVRIWQRIDLDLGEDAYELSDHQD